MSFQATPLLEPELEPLLEPEPELELEPELEPEPIIKRPPMASMLISGLSSRGHLNNTLGL